MGLGISRRLIHLMGGTVGVHSTPGEGSTFWFSVNLEASSVRAKRVLTADLRSKRVLVVDDNANAAAVLCEQLLTLGCRAHGLVSGVAALAELQRAARAGEPYDVVMTDWQMPEMDGMELVQRIDSSDLKQIPHKVLVTAYGTDSAGPQATQSGIAHLLQKPVSQSMLFDAMVGLFGTTEAAPLSPADTAAVKALLGPVRGAHILLVEDNEINQQVAKEILESEGFVVSLADNGQHAIIQVGQSLRTQSPFDLVLMDIQMPVLDGVSATHLIRSMPEFAKLPIVAMTASGHESDRQLCLRSGMNDFVKKPIDPMALWQALARWIHPREDLGLSAAPRAGRRLSAQAAAMQILRSYLERNDSWAMGLFQQWRWALRQRLGDDRFVRAEALLRATNLAAALKLLQQGGVFSGP
jgi:CheY-like chemotaxis protein